MKPKHVIAVALALSLGTLLSARVVFALCCDPPDNAALSEESAGGGAVGTYVGPTTLLATDAVAGLDWKLVQYATSASMCLDARLYNGTDLLGETGGCGLPTETATLLNVCGGIRSSQGSDGSVGAEMSACFGKTTPAVATVRATFSGGGTATRQAVSGAYVIGAPAGQTITQVAALDVFGQVLVSEPVLDEAQVS